MATLDQVSKCKKLVKNEVMAALLLSGFNKLHYGGLKSMLTQHMYMGMNQYPCTVDETSNILNTYNKTTKGGQHFKSNAKAPEHQSEVVFSQSNATKKVEHFTTDVTCYHCGKPGHYAKNCPKKTNYLHTTVSNAHNTDNDNDSEEHIFHQTGTNNLSKDWVLLDNQRALDKFVNAHYLNDIYTVLTPIMVYCNAGSTSTNQQGVVWPVLHLVQSKWDCKHFLPQNCY